MACKKKCADLVPIVNQKGVIWLDDCVFCEIRDGNIPATKVYEDEQFLAFRDINPQAPTHILLIPREHIASLNDLKEEHRDMLGEMLLVAKKLARDAQIDQDGYRLVVNCNRQAGQEVFHLHMHVLGGRMFTWPPG